MHFPFTYACYMARLPHYHDIWLIYRLREICTTHRYATCEFITTACNVLLGLLGSEKDWGCGFEDIFKAAFSGHSNVHPEYAMKAQTGVQL
jgi:hypothetical protein